MSEMRLLWDDCCPVALQLFLRVRQGRENLLSGKLVVSWGFLLVVILGIECFAWKSGQLKWEQARGQLDESAMGWQWQVARNPARSEIR